MKAIILAGGLGTRLRHLIPDLPKPMAPVAGRPFLEYVIERLVAGGMNDVILSVGYRAEIIRAHFGRSWGGASISYAEEAHPLGTGGAIANAMGDHGDAALVLNGDTFLGLDFADLLAWFNCRTDAASMAMVLRRVEDVARYGAVLCDGDLVSGFVEKGHTGPGLINAGVYIVRPGLFHRLGLAGSFSLETDVLHKHLATIQPKAYVTDAFFIDIGVPEDFVRSQTEIPLQALA